MWTAVVPQASARSDLQQWHVEAVRIGQIDEIQAVPQLDDQVREALVGLEFLELEDPFAVNRGIEQRREPQQPGQVRMIGHQSFQPGVAGIGDPHRPDRYQVVIEALERETVEVDEIAGHLKADDMPPVVVVDHSRNEAVEQDRAALGNLATMQQDLAVRIPEITLDQVLERRLFFGGHGMTQTSLQKQAGLRMEFTNHEAFIRFTYVNLRWVAVTGQGHDGATASNP